MTFKPSLLTEKMNEKILSIAKRNSFDRAMQNKQPILRARSASKDYKRYRDNHANWRQLQLKLQEMKEMENCTFKPNIQKSTQKYKNSVSTYFSTNLSSMAQIPTNSSASNCDSKAAQTAGGTSKLNTAPSGAQTPAKASFAASKQPLSNLKDQNDQETDSNEQPPATTIQQKLQSMQRFEQLYQVGKAHF